MASMATVICVAIGIPRDFRPGSGFLDRLVDDLLAAVVAVGRHVMAPMRLAGGRVDRQRRLGQRVMRATMAAPGAGLPIFLNSHCKLQSGRTRPDGFTST